VAVCTHLPWITAKTHAAATRTGTAIAIFIFGIWIALVIAILFSNLRSIHTRTRLRRKSIRMADGRPWPAGNATQWRWRGNKNADRGPLAASVAAASRDMKLGAACHGSKLASGELWNELQTSLNWARRRGLDPRSKRTDARLFLRNMGRAGKTIYHLRQAPFLTVLKKLPNAP